MSLLTHPVAIWIRGVLRGAGLTRPLQLLIAGKSYEAAVDSALLGALRSGDVIWDVGANVGLYTAKMAALTGPAGRVFAFEPSPTNLERLRTVADAHANVSVMACGLSSRSGTLQLVQGDDDLGATSRLAGADGAQTEGAVFTVDLRTGDEVIRSGNSAIPNVVKIDVEGHELRVLEGMRETLRERRLRSIIVEVHFGLLAAGGESSAPKAIEAMLSEAGFRLRWIDSSHLLGVRPATASAP
jgi:FkbM family methyltransferase